MTPDPRDAEIARLREELARLQEPCTCGSGGHPRSCRQHPWAKEAHAATAGLGRDHGELESGPRCLDRAAGRAFRQRSHRPHRPARRVPRRAARGIPWGGYVKPRRTLLPVNPKNAHGQRKVPLHVVPPALLIQTARAISSNTYAPYNWRDNGVVASVYYAAIQRHLNAWWDGQDLDTDSGVSHLAHAAGGIAILLDAISAGNFLDDRPPPGPAAEILADAMDRARLLPPHPPGVFRAESPHGRPNKPDRP